MLIIDKIFILLGLVLEIYCIVLSVTMGPISFAVPMALMGAGLMAVGGLPLIFREGLIPLIGHRLLVPAVIAVFCIMAVSECFVLHGIAAKDVSPVDYTIVLGAGLRGDKVPLTLRTRLQAALDADGGEVIVVSGGQGPRETVTEASAMKKWLIEKGVEPERILAEDRSTDTHENLTFSAELIEAHSGKAISDVKVRIISSDFHCTRAKLLAGRLGYGKVTACGGKTPAALIPVNHIRESMALIKSLLFDHPET